MPDSITMHDREDLRSALENERLFSALSDSIVARSISTFEQRHSEKRNLYLALGTVVVGLVGALLTIVTDELLDFRIDRQLKIAMEAESHELKFETRVASLDVKLLQLDNGDGYNPSDADAIIGEIESLYAKYADKQNTSGGVTLEEILRNQKRMAFAVDTSFRNFASASDNSSIERLSQAAPELANGSTSATQALTQNRGMELLAAPGGSADWLSANGALYETRKTYRDWVKKADSTGYPELFIAFELFVRDMEGAGEKELMALAARVEDLDRVDRRAFDQVVSSLAMEAFRVKPNSESYRIASRVRETLAKLAPVSPALADIEVGLEPLRTL